MAPNSASTVAEKIAVPRPQFETKVVWFNVWRFTFIHAGFLHGVYLAVSSAYFKTTVFAFIYCTLGLLGITAGAHRLWSHRCYKAKWPLRAILSVLCSIAAQGNIYVWCRDHRSHHKFTETDADPHNIERGFFFAHIGWLMCEKHPDVATKGKTVYLEDLWADPIVRFHKRFYKPMVTFFSFFLPTMIPMWLWNETVWNSFFVAGMARYAANLHFTFLVNSAAHYYGARPYDKFVEARENSVVAFLAHGEGWHNYHHAFPWDYAASELGYTLNITKIFIDAFALIGWAYDLKTARPELVHHRKLKRGDGTRIKQSQNALPSNVDSIAGFEFGRREPISVRDLRLALRAVGDEWRSSTARDGGVTICFQECFS